MQNIANNMCEAFHCDWLRNDRALGNGKSDNKNPKNNVCSAWGPVSGSKSILFLHVVGLPILVLFFAHFGHCENVDTIQYNTMRVFSAPYTRNRTGRHYNSHRMCV